MISFLLVLIIKGRRKREDTAYGHNFRQNGLNGGTDFMRRERDVMSLVLVASRNAPCVVEPNGTNTKEAC